MGELASVERVATALQGKEPDRVPVGTLAISRALWEIDERPKDAQNDPETMAKAKIAANENFGDDMVIAGIDGCFVEAKACGAQGFWSEHMEIVDATQRTFESWDEIDDLEFPDLEEHIRTSSVLRESAILMDEVGDQKAVAPIVSGVFSTAANLIGHEELYRGMYEEPEKVHEFLEKLNEFHIEYHTAFEGKAHGVVVLDPVAATETTSPPQYEEFVLPYLKEDFKAIADTGMIPINHPCGDTTGIIQMVADSIPDGAPGGIHANYGNVDKWPKDVEYLEETLGEDNIEYDEGDPYSIMLQAVKKDVGDQVCILGNVDPVTVLLEGDPQTVKETARRNIEYGAEGGGFILTPACDTNPNTPSENFKALVEAAKEYGQYE
ncbi:MAG: uroporphyrinogen decarboxylase family protein [Halodesulfurarchaeum sp.]